MNRRGPRAPAYITIMEPAPLRRPPLKKDIYHPLFTSPDGRLGYIKIHKNGTNTYARHLRQNLGWMRSFREGSGLSMRKRFRRDPHPEKIIVITRNPFERYVSGLVQVSGSQIYPDILDRAVNSSGIYHHNFNQHLWPHTWFLEEWMHFYDIMEAVDIEHAAVWFEEHGVPLPPEGERHRNQNPRPAIKHYTEALMPRYGEIRFHFRRDDEFFLERGGYAY